jgi:hypothetical protein
MSKKYKSSLNFVFRVFVETRCLGRIPGPQLAGNKPRFVAYIIVSVFCSSEGWSTSDPNSSRLAWAKKFMKPYLNRKKLDVAVHACHSSYVVSIK